MDLQAWSGALHWSERRQMHTRTVCIAGRVALEITKNSSPFTEGNTIFSFMK